MIVEVCILANDEGSVITDSLAQLARQSFIRASTNKINIHVVANGCTDDTVGVARSNSKLFDGSRVKLHVHDLLPRGKSRAWNRAVHELVNTAAEFLVFLDADITFLNEVVVSGMLDCLINNPELAACAGFPVKDVSLKSKKSVLDHFSLIVSGQSWKPGAINGSLYVVRARIAREIWLPDCTPGEDGFLNAMVKTRGFTGSVDTTGVTTNATPTHTFHAHKPLEFVSHERRMIVGTMVNRWIFEHLWSLRLSSPAGPLIRDWNESDPGWVDRLVLQRAENRSWLIPNAILFGRFKRRRNQPLWKRAAYLPVAAAATLLTLLPAILANRRLKKTGAATTW